MDEGTANMQPRNLETEFDLVKDDLAKLRADIANLSLALKGVTAETLHEQIEQVRGRLDRFGAGAKAHGREAIEDLTGRIEERPLASILLAFGAGLLFGRLLDR